MMELSSFTSKMLLISAALAAGGACSVVEDKQLTVGKVTYHFPADHVEGFTKAGAGEPYARIRPPGKSFDLIYSAQARYRRNWLGGDTPLLTSVTDHPAPDFEQFSTPSGVTVCRSDHPHYGCGLRIEDEGVAWSVVFDRDQVPNSDAIRASALRLLDKYKG